MKKICFVASSGGHFEQLMMLYPLMKINKSFVLTEKTNYQYNTKGIKRYEVNQINRKEKMFFLKFIILVYKCFIIFIKEKPDVIISTGALIAIPISLIGKIFRKKVIFIESFAKVNTPTLTGKILYRFSDLFIVQWRSMKKVYPKAVYRGGIY